MASGRRSPALGVCEDRTRAPTPCPGNDATLTVKDHLCAPLVLWRCYDANGVAAIGTVDQTVAGGTGTVIPLWRNRSHRAAAEETAPFEVDYTVVTCETTTTKESSASEVTMTVADHAPAG